MGSNSVFFEMFCIESLKLMMTLLFLKSVHESTVEKGPSPSKHAFYRKCDYLDFCLSW